MKDDPYAGLDQQLFRESPKPAPTTKQPNNETTSQRDNAAAMPRANEATHERSGHPSKEPAHAPANARAPVAASPRRRERVSEATRTRASASRGHVQAARLVERHSHDVFVDQVRWLNRRKLEIEEAYDLKVTINAMVALALDLLIDDYEAHDERSALMRVLVFGEERRTEEEGS